MKMLRKGQVGGLQGFILSIVTVAIVLAIGLIILSELQTSQVTNVAQCNSSDKSGCNSAYNATGAIVGKMATIPTWIGIIIIVSLAFIVLSFFVGRRQ